MIDKFNQIFWSLVFCQILMTQKILPPVGKPFTETQGFLSAKKQYEYNIKVFADFYLIFSLLNAERKKENYSSGI